MEAGRPGRHGDSAVPPVGQDLKCASAPATTLRPDMGGGYAWGQAETRGDRPDLFNPLSSRVISL